MFRKHYLLRLFGSIAVAASIAVVGARTANAGNSYDPNAYVYGGASQAVAQAIQSADYGSNRSPATARHQEKVAHAQGLHFITDTLGGNGQLPARSGGGGSAVA